MDPGPLELIAADLAPGDTAARGFDWSGLHLQRIRTPAHPLFQPVYRRLWKEFGSRGEMEREAVIASRLEWDPARPVDRHALRYEMVAVTRGDEIVAIRDHTVMRPCAPSRTDQPRQVIAHLSHVLVEPALRGTGLSGWLRALPIQTARECGRAAGEPVCDRITLIAEMEHPDGVTPMVMARLRSYARAGFVQIDPDAVRYCQPDFRAPAAIALTSVQPVPLALVTRRVGREAEPWISGAEVRELVTALYTMFGVHVRAEHMAPLWALLDQLPAPRERIRLRRPLP